jgi:3-hydroxyisobutyrate dehydrogenase-like beta-hydroxyacid dehydrogenase
MAREHAGEPTPSLAVTAVAVLGLGEAGSRLAADLVAAGARVQGCDPLAGSAPAGVVRRPDPASTVAGCDVILSLTAAGAALEAAAAALPSLAPGAIYADLNTARPALKRALATLVAGSGGRFADVALLGPVPARGLGTPSLASGEGAEAFARALGPLGMPVEVVSGQAGDAAALKLLRLVFLKGLAAAAIESLSAAEAAGHAEWLEQQLADVIGRALLDRLLAGSRVHAARRPDEMEAARDLVLELGVEPRIASASMALLAELSEGRGR